jgi:hypothetical protein
MMGRFLWLLIVGISGWYFNNFISELYDDRYWIRTLNDILILSWGLGFLFLLFIYLLSKWGRTWLLSVSVTYIFYLLLFLMAALHGNMNASTRYNTTLIHTQYLIDRLEEYHSEHGEYPDNIDLWMSMPFYQWITYGGTKRYPFYRNDGNQYILTIEQPTFRYHDKCWVYRPSVRKWELDY